MTSELGSSVGTDDHCIILSTRANQAKEIWTVTVRLSHQNVDRKPQNLFLLFLRQE